MSHEVECEWDVIESPCMEGIGCTQHIVEVVCPKIIRHPTQDENPCIRLRRITLVPGNGCITTREEEGKDEGRNGEGQTNNHITTGGERLKDSSGHDDSHGGNPHTTPG